MPRMLFRLCNQHASWCLLLFFFSTINYIKKMLFGMHTRQTKIMHSILEMWNKMKFDMHNQVAPTQFKNILRIVKVLGSLVQCGNDNEHLKCKSLLKLFQQLIKGIFTTCYTGCMASQQTNTIPPYAQWTDEHFDITRTQFSTFWWLCFQCAPN